MLASTGAVFDEEYVAAGAIDTTSEPGKKKFTGGDWGDAPATWGAVEVNVTSDQGILFIRQRHESVTV